jgi:hypothetical protein
MAALIFRAAIFDFNPIEEQDLIKFSENNPNMLFENFS